MKFFLEDQITFILQTQKNAWCWETAQCSFSVLFYLIYQHFKNSLEELFFYHVFGFFCHNNKLFLIDTHEHMHIYLSKLKKKKKRRRITG